MQYEVWELRSRSLVGSYDEEEHAVSLVRRLLEDGWPADQLVLGAEDDTVDIDGLPPTLTGSDLLLRVGGPNESQAPRSM
jgi:hypothetical protein